MKVSIATCVTVLAVCAVCLLYAQQPPSIPPLEGSHQITSTFGPRIHPIKKKEILHKGVDFRAPQGTPVLATSDGTVIKTAYQENGYGNYIVIRHDERYQTLYSQLSDMKVEVGQTVKKGTVIGTVGNSGASTGPHLHYEVLMDGDNVDPALYLQP